MLQTLAAFLLFAIAMVVWLILLPFLILAAPAFLVWYLTRSAPALDPTIA